MVLESVEGLVGDEGVSVVGKISEKAAKFLNLFVGNEKFGGRKTGEFVFELLAVGELGNGEFARGVIGAGEAEVGLLGGASLEDGGEVGMLGVVEEGEVVDGGGGDDLGDLALDNLSGFGSGRLLGDGDALVGFDELGDVALRGVVRDAAHWDVVSLGEGDVEDAGGGFGVLEEHLVEVPETVEEEDIVGQGSPHGHILGHHRGELLFACCHS